MTPKPPLPFPDLPVDVARTILECAASNDRKDALQLVHVSKAVRNWIDPILYHTIVLKAGQRANQLATAINLRRDPLFFATHVKRLCVCYAYYREGMLEFFLRLFTGITSLAWWIAHDPLVPFISQIAPKYLSLANVLSSEVHSLFPSSITHLDLKFHDGTNPTGPQTIEEGPVWHDVFAHCPCLTHIALDSPLLTEDPPMWESHAVRFVHSILSAAPSSFRTLVIYVWGNSSTLRSNLIELATCMCKEPRFIILVPPSCQPEIKGTVYHSYSLQGTWEYPENGPNLWEVVDLELQWRQMRHKEACKRD